MNSKKKTVIKIFIIATIQSFLYYSLTYIVYRAFGNSGISYFQIVPAQAFFITYYDFLYQHLVLALVQKADFYLFLILYLNKELLIWQYYFGDYILFIYQL